MSWVKLDDQFFRNRKAARAGKDGRALYLAGLCHCAAQLTDGFVADEELRFLCTDAQVRPKVADVLVAEGLWARVDGGWVVPDYLKFNPAGDKVKADRDAHAQRMREARARPRDSARDPAREGARAPGSDDCPTPPHPKDSTTPPPTRLGDETAGGDVLSAALRLMAEAEADSGRYTINSRSGWVNARVRSLRTEHEPEARRLLDLEPDATGAGLAGYLTGAKPLRVVREHCDVCDDMGVVLNELDEAVDCECKGRRSA